MDGWREEWRYANLSLFLQFMDLRTRYTALVTLTTQHVQYISDALRRLEEEEVGVKRSQFSEIYGLNDFASLTLYTLE